MPPSALPIHCAPLMTPLGSMLLAAQSDHLIGAWFEGQKNGPVAQGWHPNPTHPVLQASAQQLHAYFAGRLTRFTLPLRFAWGTAFQRAVWQLLTQLPYGHSWTYGELAHRLARPRAYRAVGAAVGLNPISVIVPCHRVLGLHGRLTGYAGGIDRKQALLEREGFEVFGVGNLKAIARE